MPPPLNPIVVQWDDVDCQTIRFDVYNGWTWDNFTAAKIEADTMIEQVTHPVDIIINTSGVTVLQQDMVVRPRQIVAESHPRARHFVIVINNRVGHTAFSLLVRLDPTRTFDSWGVASSLDDARAMLQGWRT